MQKQKRAGKSGILPAGVWVDGVPYKSTKSFRWLFIGLKRLEIEWKPHVILSKRGNCRQKTFYSNNAIFREQNVFVFQ